jgi:ribose 5-phosphate isomerase A
VPQSPSAFKSLLATKLWLVALKYLCFIGMNPKQRAAEAALSYVKDGMVVGLGTGSTADFFLEALGTAITSGKLRDIRGVPTSKYSELRAQKLGITTATLAQCPSPDITIDGADEVDPNLELIKGAGGALLREKMVAQNSRKLVIIVDSSKVVQKLGQRYALPVEVAIFGYQVHEAFFRSLGAQPMLRVEKPSGHPFVTDNGNYIYDCRFTQIDQPHNVESKMKSRAGIIETGLFLGLAGEVLIGGEDKVLTLKRNL